MRGRSRIQEERLESVWAQASAYLYTPPGPGTNTETSTCFWKLCEEASTDEEPGNRGNAVNCEGQLLVSGLVSAKPLAGMCSFMITRFTNLDFKLLSNFSGTRMVDLMSQ